mmetsp:Transcript_35206/g.86368  ORF Transcript_35206/g.86368 Transcript_35206/m.86368 type:complete len:1038 (-) Transcript_35206:366-3479(-)
MVPECYISKIDLADAFFVRPVDATQCDFLGIKHEKTGEYYRYRFMPFGVASSPWSMQRLAVEIKRVINEQGLKHVAPFLSTGEVNPAADYTGFRCAAAYLDDFAFIHPPWLSEEQAKEQFNSVLKVYAEFGKDVVRREKCDPPARRQEFLGITLDSSTQQATVSDERAAKLIEEISEFKKKIPGRVSRKAVASMAGKIQFVAPYIRDGQASLAPLYQARDAFVNPSDATDQRRAWKDSTLVEVGAKALAALDCITEALRAPEGRKVYLSDTGLNSSFWLSSQVTAPDDVIDANGVTEHGIDVITTDASGYAGGAWFLNERFRYDFEESDASPNSSSNWRELHTIVEAVRRWAPKLRGRRVLIRTDNSTCVSVITRRNSRADSLRTLYLELSGICHEHDIDLAARHIPGERNTLSDMLSRWRKRHDTQDWQFSPGEFVRWNAGREHDVDACCDPEGFNALLPRFWSEVDDALDHSWVGLNVWCNPPYDDVERFMVHALTAHAASPGNTSATFVVPDWPWASWYRLVAHFDVEHVYPEGSRLFTAPERKEDNPGKRCFRGETQWPVMVLRLHPTRRLAAASPSAAAGSTDGGPRAAGKTSPDLCPVQEADGQSAGVRSLRIDDVPSMRLHDGKTAPPLAPRQLHQVSSPPSSASGGQRGSLPPPLRAPLHGGRLSGAHGANGQPAELRASVLQVGRVRGPEMPAGRPERDRAVPAAPPPLRPGRHLDPGARPQRPLGVAHFGGAGTATPITSEPGQAGSRAVRLKGLRQENEENGQTNDEVDDGRAGADDQDLQERRDRLARPRLPGGAVPGHAAQGSRSGHQTGAHRPERPALLRHREVRRHHHDASNAGQVHPPFDSHRQKRGPWASPLRLHSRVHKDWPELRRRPHVLPHRLSSSRWVSVRSALQQAREVVSEHPVHAVGRSRAPRLQPRVPQRQEGGGVPQLQEVRYSGHLQQRPVRGQTGRHRGLALRQVHRVKVLRFAFNRQRTHHRRRHLRHRHPRRHDDDGRPTLMSHPTVTVPRESSGFAVPDKNNSFAR